MPTKTYKAKDFNNRQALVETIVSDSGRTVDKKDAIVTGTVVELEELGLGHNSTIWGVPVVASDYKVNNYKPVKRGKRFPSKINGNKT